MRKHIALLLALVMLLGVMLTACGGADTASGQKDDTVIIYIPATVTYFDGEGNERFTTRIEFEEGWQDKETFEARYTASVEIDDLATLMTFGDKTATSIYDTGSLDRTEIKYNDRGQTVEQTTYYRENDETNVVEKEIAEFIYDDRGLLISEAGQVYLRDGETVQAAELTYTYEQTDTGYVGTGDDGEDSDFEYVVVCDEEGRRLSLTICLNDEEQSRTEYTYDEHGDQISVKIYSGGELVSRNETTYTTVEVSEETAKRLPQFRRAN